MIEFNGTAPTGDQIQARRLAYGLTQPEAAALVYKESLSWSRYERGLRHIDLAVWELFCLKTSKMKPKKKQHEGRGRPRKLKQEPA